MFGHVGVLCRMLSILYKLSIIINQVCVYMEDATEIQTTPGLLHAQTLAVHLIWILELSTLSCKVHVSGT